MSQTPVNTMPSNGRQKSATLPARTNISATIRGVSGTSPRNTQLPMLTNSGCMDTIKDTSHAGVMLNATSHVVPRVVYARNPSRNRAAT
jgi:hypothetical protein